MVGRERGRWVKRQHGSKEEVGHERAGRDLGNKEGRAMIETVQQIFILASSDSKL